MKKKNYALLAFAVGLLLLLVQFLIFAFQYINGGASDAQIIFTTSEGITFGDFLSQFWWGLAGTLLLIILFVRRLTKGPEAMLTLVGGLLWVVQILSRFESQEFLDFILAYVIGIVGVVLVAIAGIYDAYIIKSGSSEDN